MKISVSWTFDRSFQTFENTFVNNCRSKFLQFMKIRDKDLFHRSKCRKWHLQKLPQTSKLSSENYSDRPIIVIKILLRSATRQLNSGSEQLRPTVSRWFENLCFAAQRTPCKAKFLWSPPAFVPSSTNDDPTIRRDSAGRRKRTGRGHEKWRERGSA